MTEKKNEWYDLAIEKAEKLKTAVINVALRSTLRDASLEERVAHTAEMAEAQEQLAAWRSEFLQLSATRTEITDEPVPV